MSNLQIEVVNVSISTVPTAKGSYQVADVAYKNKTFQDKLEGKKVMSFSNKEVFNTLSQAKFGDVFEVTRVKNDKGFWDWVSLGTAGSVPTEPVSTGTSAASSGFSTPVKTGTVTPKSNYETSEERAARQVLIVKQSSISSAVELAIANKVKDPQEVIAIAKQFEAYVWGKEEEVATSPDEVGGSFDDFENDLP